LLHFLKYCVILISGKNYLSALPNSSGQPSTEGGSLPSDLRKGGLPDEYIRSVTALFGYHWYLRPVYSGQKEVTAGTLTSTAITFANL